MEILFNRPALLLKLGGSDQRSLKRNCLVCSVFVGNDDFKAFQQVTSLNTYPLVKVLGEVCLAHVAKRLKKSIKKIKHEDKINFQHKLPEWNENYIVSNYLPLSYRVEQHMSSHELYAFSSIIYVSHNEFKAIYYKIKLKFITTQEKTREFVLHIKRRKLCSAFLYLYYHVDILLAQVDIGGMTTSTYVANCIHLYLHIEVISQMTLCIR